MKIKELASMANVDENVLRFYEEKGLLHPKRDRNGYRNYDMQDYNRFMLILLYRKMDFSIAQIKEMLYNENAENQIELFFKQQALLHHQIEELSMIQEGITNCLNQMFLGKNNQHKIVTLLQDTVDNIGKVNAWKDQWNFDDWAKNYDEDVHKPVEDGLKFYVHYEKVLDQCANKVHEVIGNVLEIGIGTGNLAQRIAKQQPITGIDQSIQMLMLTKKKYPDISVCVGTFLNIPFADHSFTTIVSSYAFHHNNEEEKRVAIQEMDRVVTQDGRIIICDLMFQDAKAREAFEKTCSSQELLEIKDEYFANIDQLCSIFDTLHYTSTVQAIDDLMWIVTAKKK